MVINFFLSGRKKDTIYCRIAWSDLQYRRSLAIQVAPKFWKQDAQRVTVTSEWPAGRHVNRILDNMRLDLESRFYELSADIGSTPTVEQVALLFEPKQAAVPLLSDFALNRARAMQSRTNGRTGVVISKVTWQKHLAVREKLLVYEKKFGPLPVNKADMLFYSRFVDMMVNDGYSLNTIGKHMSIIRSWLRQADAEGIAVHPAYKSSEWYIGRERVSHVSLNLDELQAIASLKLTGMLERVRDLFLLSAYTGLRYSDVSKLAAAEFKDGLITLEQQKTSDQVVIPELPEVTLILAKYRERGQSAPAAISNVRMNLHLKTIAELAGLTGEFIDRKTQGGKRIENRLRVCDAVTTHTARRSFAKNLFTSGFNLSWLSRILGHSSQEQTIEYIGMDAIEKAELLKKHWLLMKKSQ